MSVSPLAIKTLGICAVVFLAACSTSGTRESKPVPIEKSPDYTPVEPSHTPAQPPAVVEPNTSGAYQGLLNKADQASSKGDYEQALALLERAQRIDPDAAEIYLSLAKTYTAKGDKALATATAERGLLYCSAQSQCDALRAYIR